MLPETASQTGDTTHPEWQGERQDKNEMEQCVLAWSVLIHSIGVLGVEPLPLADERIKQMPDSTIKMIALDLDGTLLGAEGRVSPRNHAALRDAQAAGIEVVIATGRRHSYALNVLRSLHLAPETLLVSSNGAVVRTFASNLIERTHMETPVARWLCGHLAEFRNALVITFDKVGPEGEDTRGALVVEELADLHASIDKWMIANAPYIAHICPIEDCLIADAPIQMMLCGTVERMRRAEALMVAHPSVAAVGDTHSTALDPAVKISLNRTEYPERDLSIVDILPAGCAKGSALLRLAAARNIQPSEIMAIGDNWNDLSMLEIAGRPILMGNAPEDLKQIAAQRNWQVTSHHLEDGVAQVLETVLLTQSVSELSQSR
jgi:hydroxymethylpyrimidine pyrophosphatase-like HAD family hydrolase